MRANMASVSPMLLRSWKTIRAITLRDDAYGEDRWVTIGMDAVARVLVVVYMWRGKSIRIISARPATQKERQQYMENP